jgi:DNA-binding LacI/PurR family transcriptional regulator
VVAADRELRTYSMHAVLIDNLLGISRLGRDLLLAGHRRLAAVEPRGSSSVAQALRQAASRYSADCVVDSCEPEEINTLVEHGATAVVCGTARAADQVAAQLHRTGIHVPDHVSLTAVGCADSTPACSGYYCNSRQIADAVVELLKLQTGRPAALWLAGEFQERGTLRPTGTPTHVDELTNVRVGGVVV